MSATPPPPPPPPTLWRSRAGGHGTGSLRLGLLVGGAAACLVGVGSYARAQRAKRKDGGPGGGDAPEVSAAEYVKAARDSGHPSEAPVAVPKGADFTEWLRANGAAVARGAAIRKTEHQGLGVFFTPAAMAVADGGAEQPVLCLPVKHTVSAHNALRHPNAPVAKVFSRAWDSGALCERDAVGAFFLLEKCRGDDSPWRTYLDALPQDAAKQGVPGWLDSQRHCKDTTAALAVLEGTTLAAAAAAERRRRHSEWSRLRPVILEAAVACSPKAATAAEALTVDDWAWAKASFWTRAMAVPWPAPDDTFQGTTIESVVPGVDCANHHVPPNARWEVCGSGDDARVCLLVDAEAAGVLPGVESRSAHTETELLVDYGAKASEELMFHHGFVDPPPGGYPKGTVLGLLGPSSAALDRASEPPAHDVLVMVFPPPAPPPDSAGAPPTLAEKAAEVRARMLACLGAPRVMCGSAACGEGGPDQAADEEAMATGTGDALEAALARRVGWDITDVARLAVAAVHARRLADATLLSERGAQAWERLLGLPGAKARPGPDDGGGGDVAAASRAVCADPAARADAWILLRQLLERQALDLLGLPPDSCSDDACPAPDLASKLRASARADVLHASRLPSLRREAHARTYVARQKVLCGAWLALASRLEARGLAYARSPPPPPVYDAHV